MSDRLRETLKENFTFSPNKNQFNDLERLIFEISRRENLTPQEVIKNTVQKNRQFPRGFSALKAALLRRRFPLKSSREKIEPKDVLLTPLKNPLRNGWKAKGAFRPLKIFVEKEVRGSALVESFASRFPELKIVQIAHCRDYLKKNKFTLAQLKKPFVFIVKEKWDFIKCCPCTPGALACGYWILNLGFGCPFDCTYCYLQQYANFPGIILPANYNIFFEKFDSFTRKIKRPIRVGTGEFSDSLALDDLTGYATKLISYFKRKNVFFELKTKSSSIGSILKIKAPSNIIISWSLNPEKIAAKEELGTAPLEMRLRAAKMAQKAGYRVGIHFDPIIHFSGWEKEYKALIDNLYRILKPPFAWISLGTLRAHRALKSIVEARSPQSNIFYGELFLSKDKKLRYPEFLRKEIYKGMIEWIREYDLRSPLYLCMEDREIWETAGGFKSAEKIENYLTRRRLK